MGMHWFLNDDAVDVTHEQRQIPEISPKCIELLARAIDGHRAADKDIALLRREVRRCAPEVRILGAGERCITMGGLGNRIAHVGILSLEEAKTPRSR